MGVYKIDATNKVLGRLASKIAILLQGKHKPNFVPYLNTGDKVIVTNTDKIKITGKKLKKKVYYRHSGYPGGLKKITLEELMKRDSREVLRKAVWGMLPKNKLRKQRIKNLKLYKGEIE
ncbi:50S ribosomal protein L13 [bacterium]|nr:50S ribosomal protein L13 [bacterium]